MSGSGEGAGGSGSPGSSRHGLAELIAERRAKALRVRESRPAAFPCAFAGSEPIADILRAYAELPTGDATKHVHRVAGPILARRGAGRAAFLDLVDRTGKIQLHARVDMLGSEAFERLTSLDVGDLI